MTASLFDLGVKIQYHTLKISNSAGHIVKETGLVQLVSLEPPYELFMYRKLSEMSISSQISICYFITLLDQICFSSSLKSKRTIESSCVFGL